MFACPDNGLQSCFYTTASPGMRGYMRGITSIELGLTNPHVSLFETGTTATISHNSADVFITGLFLENVMLPCLKRRYYYFHALISAVSVFFFSVEAAISLYPFPTHCTLHTLASVQPPKPFEQGNMLESGGALVSWSCDLGEVGLWFRGHVTWEKWGSGLEVM